MVAVTPCHHRVAATPPSLVLRRRNRQHANRQQRRRQHLSATRRRRYFRLAASGFGFNLISPYWVFLHGAHAGFRAGCVFRRRAHARLADVRLGHRHVERGVVSRLAHDDSRAGPGHHIRRRGDGHGADGVRVVAPAAAVAGLPDVDAGMGGVLMIWRRATR